MRQRIFSILFYLASVITVGSSALIEERAVITHIADGDTFDVRYSGDTEDTRIRFLGVQAMEIHPTAEGTPSDCYADEAKQRLIELTGGVGSTVILRAKDLTTEIRYRLARHIFTTINGKEVNVVKRLMEEGLVIPFLHATEDTYNDEYLLAAKKAKKLELGLWSPKNHCATSADSMNSSFDIKVYSDADGDDDSNLNGEWVKIKNTSGRSVDISDWWLRDSALNFFRIPSSTVLSNNEEIIVYGGGGLASGNTFYWGNENSLFDKVGDGIYFCDYLDDFENPNDTIFPKGNIKASFLYPCRGVCSDSLQGRIKIDAYSDANGDDNLNLNGEWIRITNESDSQINLKNYVIHSAPEGSDGYFFGEETYLNAGEALFLYSGVGTDTNLKKYWGKTKGVLANETDRVWLSTLDKILIAEFSWPCTSNCSDKLDGKIKLDVRYDAPGIDDKNLNGEWVRVTNISNKAIDLKDYVLSSAPLGSDSYFFASTTVLEANSQLYLYSGSGTDSNLKKYWNKSRSVHANIADKVWLHRLDNYIIEETSWPNREGEDTLLNKIEMTVNYDAEGNDNQNLNGEWVKIKNISSSEINLQDYLIISNPVGSASYYFEKSTPLKKDEILLLYIGSGTDSSLIKYWGNKTSILANTQDRVALVNLSGRVIVEEMWPCIGECTDGLQGKIALEAHFDAEGVDNNNLNDEWIRVTNISGSTVDLRNYTLHSEPIGSAHYTFMKETLLHAGEELFLYTGIGTDSRVKKYWNKRVGVLANSADRIWLDTSDGILIAEHNWPCVVNCNESLKGKIDIIANYDAEGVDDNNLNDEWIRITNKSKEVIDLKDHVIHSLPSGSDNYVFLKSTVLNPTEELYLYIGFGTDSHLKRYWNKSKGILSNTQDKVWIDTLAGNLIAEFSWPNNSVSSGLSAKIKIIANYDAEGDDNNNLNGEWIRLTNISTEDINLKNYIIHSLPFGSDHYVFYNNTIVHSNEELYLYIGSGTETRLKKYWSKSKSLLANSGDKVWLAYMDGTVIKEFSWPCIENCTDKMIGKLEITARFDADGNDETNLNGEWVRIYNKSDGLVNLKDYTLNSAPIGSDKYTFSENTILDKGESLYLYTGVGEDTTLKKYWNKNHSVLSNRADKVWLSTYDGQSVVAFEWPCFIDCKDDLDGKITLRVQYDALGDDSLNPNGEWVTIENTSKSIINIQDYILKMNSQSYHFSSSTNIESNGYIRLYVGSGTDTSTKRYWKKETGIFSNSGGEVSLVNMMGSLISKQKWPCQDGCQYDTALEIIEVNYDAEGSDSLNPNGEWITIKNRTNRSVNSRDWTLLVRGYQHHFLTNFIISAGAEVKIFIGKGSNTLTERYWGLKEGILRNGGDIVKLVNPQQIVSHCFSWGAEVSSCSSMLDSDNDGILNIQDRDDDGDGISDALEIKYGLNPLYFADAKEDNDNDGFSNISEIKSHSNPNNINDFPQKETGFIKYDFNKDGIADILWKKDSQNYLWYMNSEGSHSYKNIGNKSTLYKIAGVADFNNDGIADILWKKGSGNYLWYMKSDGSHSYKNIGKKSTSYKIAEVADFNNDGIADILWKKGSGNYLWYMKSDGSHSYKNIGKKSTEYVIQF